MTVNAATNGGSARRDRSASQTTIAAGAQSADSLTKSASPLRTPAAAALPVVTRSATTATAPSCKSTASASPRMPKTVEVAAQLATSAPARPIASGHGVRRRRSRTRRSTTRAPAEASVRSFPETRSSPVRRASAPCTTKKTGMKRVPPKKPSSLRGGYTTPSSTAAASPIQAPETCPTM